MRKSEEALFEVDMDEYVIQTDRIGPGGSQGQSNTYPRVTEEPQGQNS